MVDTAAWKTTLVWRPPVTYQVEGQAHRCLQVTPRPASQDVSSVVVSTIIYFDHTMTSFVHFKICVYVLICIS